MPEPGHHSRKQVRQRHAVGEIAEGVVKGGGEEGGGGRRRRQQVVIRTEW